MKIEEEWMTHILKRIKEKYGAQIKEVFGVDIIMPKLPFPRISFIIFSVFSSTVADILFFIVLLYNILSYFLLQNIFNNIK